jgi:amino acid permease
MRLIARLSPFWAVVVLLVGLTLPQSLLALPIAAAGVGTVPALVVLAAIGGLMSVSLAAETEALARDREFRSGGGFYSAFVVRYLGVEAAAVPTALAALRTGLSVLAGYVGLSVTLAQLTGAPRVMWGLLTIAALTVVLIRGGVRTRAAAAALIGVGCLALLAVIGAIAAAHGTAHNLTSSGTHGARAFGDLLGLVLILYLGSVYVLQVAREDLPSDPGGRALIAGTAAGTVLTTAIAAVWLVAVSSALPAAKLVGESGTVLGPLASRYGVAVTVLATALSLLLLGLGTERAAVAFMDLVAERMPRPRLVPVLAPAAICVLGEALLELGEVSFSGVFNAAGIAANVVLGLAVPVLLVRASRRSDEPAPAVRVPLIGRRGVARVLLVGDALLLAALATVLADGAVERVAAAIALAGLATVVWLSRRDL